MKYVGYCIGNRFGFLGLEYQFKIFHNTIWESHVFRKRDVVRVFHNNPNAEFIVKVEFDIRYIIAKRHKKYRHLMVYDSCLDYLTSRIFSSIFYVSKKKALDNLNDISELPGLSNLSIHRIRLVKKVFQQKEYTLDEFKNM